MGTVRCELTSALRRAIRNCVLIFPKTGVGERGNPGKPGPGPEDEIVTGAEGGLDSGGRKELERWIRMEMRKRKGDEEGKMSRSGMRGRGKKERRSGENENDIGE